MTLHVEIPNPKVLERPSHRQFTAEYKKRTLEQYESAVKGDVARSCGRRACTRRISTPGASSAMLEVSTGT